MLSLSCLICTSWWVAVKKISSVELPVNPETIFNSSLRGIGIPSWGFGLHENFQAWRLWLCWHSSFAHLASPCTCGCKRQGKKEKKITLITQRAALERDRGALRSTQKPPFHACVCVHACWAWMGWWYSHSLNHHCHPSRLQRLRDGRGDLFG